MKVFVVELPAPAPSGRLSLLRRIPAALLIAAVTLPVQPVRAADAADVSQPAPDPSSEDIIVFGQSLFRDVRPEQELDEQGVASYGVSTVDELLGEVEGELGEDEQPLILVNGERIDDLGDMAGYPVEVLRKVQVLPRGSAVRLGGSSGQRVINLTLVRKLRAATVTAASKVATDGGWHADRGEALLTYLQGPTRANLALRLRDEDALFESDRDIIQPAARLPFALQGNVIGFPNTSGEIDPLLSDLAGDVVTIAGVPSGSSPSLAEFAAFANQGNVTDLGRFRTLRPELSNYDLNGNVATRLAPWLTSSATLRLNRVTTLTSRGLPTALLRLSADNAFSPFSDDVALAYYGQDALHSRSRRNSAEARLTFNGRFGRWSSNFNVRHSESKDVFRTERQATLGTILIGDSVNPFTADVSELAGIDSDRSIARSRADVAQLSFTGPLVKLPAGDLQATLEGRLAWNRLRSESSFALPSGTSIFRRDEQSVRGAIDVPITSRDQGILAAIGDLGASAEYTRLHFSDAGSLHGYSLGLNWEPVPFLQLHGSIEENDEPAQMQLLGNPVVETPGVRVFDPLTGATVDVLQITGGNPLLGPEKVKVRRLSGLLRLVPRLNLELKAEYTDSDGRGFVSSLPPASLAVMLAFPDRYIRDSNGVLTTVDLRPVNFATHREQGLRWGLSLKTRLGGTGGRAVRTGSNPDSETNDEDGPGAAATSASRRALGRPSTYLQLNVNHRMVFSDEIRIRSGLDPVNLLEGGAIGIGGGRVRHQIDATAALTSGGLGARAAVTWRGKSSLQTRFGDTTDTLRFSPLLAINFRLFADARRLLPRAQWAKGLRLSLDVLNATNDRQGVRDSAGNTPLQYQPAYRDPIGRTIELEIRKVF